MRLSLVTLLAIVGLSVAVPQGCQSNSWEKIHEGHGHNINSGDVGTAHLGLKLPGGSGCYKGAKVGAGESAPPTGKLGGSGKGGLGKVGKGSAAASGEAGHSHSRKRHD